MVHRERRPSTASKPLAAFLKLDDIKGEIVLDTTPPAVAVCFKDAAGFQNDALTPGGTYDGGGGTYDGGGGQYVSSYREDGANRFTTGGGGDSIINNGGHFEMQGGIDLRSDNRFVFEPLEVMTNLVGTNDSGLDADGGFQPWEVSAVEIGRPPDPKMWLQLLG